MEKGESREGMEFMLRYYGLWKKWDERQRIPTRGGFGVGYPRLTDASLSGLGKRYRSCAGGGDCENSRTFSTIVDMHSDK